MTKELWSKMAGLAKLGALLRLASIDKASASEVIGSSVAAHMCSVCGASPCNLLDEHQSPRESYRCTICRASSRERAAANSLVMLLGAGGAGSLSELAGASYLDNLKIFEPGVIGALRQYLEPLPGYTNSFYAGPGTEGEVIDGLRSENLECLTFGCETFDVIITSDILEHVRRPEKALSEISRVLRPRGVHICTVPSQLPLCLNTKRRVDVSGERDIYIEEPRYHGNGKGGKSLVYNDFGQDLISLMSQTGTYSFVMNYEHVHPELSTILTFVSIKLPG